MISLAALVFVSAFQNRNLETSKAFLQLLSSRRRILFRNWIWYPGFQG